MLFHQVFKQIYITDVKMEKKVSFSVSIILQIIHPYGRARSPFAEIIYTNPLMYENTPPSESRQILLILLYVKLFFNNSQVPKSSKTICYSISVSCIFLYSFYHGS